MAANPSASSAEPTGSDRPVTSTPDFFIVGHPKCGTTALHQMLRTHPEIHMPLKEPRYFALELRSRFRRFGPRKLPVTREDYLALFAGARADQRVGEASPQYLRSETAARLIADFQPDARIIAILREPASFLHSFHLQAVHNHVETTTDFAKAIGLEDARRAGRRIPPFSQAPRALLYSDHVRYVDQLRRYHDAFGAEQVLVLIYDDFRSDNAGTVKQVLRFLDVEDTLAIEPIRTEPLAAVRSPLLYQLSTATSVVRRKATRARKASEGTRARPRRRSRAASGKALWRRAVYKAPSPPPEDFMRELRRRFKPEVVALSDYLGRDLVAEWGYDRID
jgi:hypothetical protein